MIAASVSLFRRAALLIAIGSACLLHTGRVGAGDGTSGRDARAKAPAANTIRLRVRVTNQVGQPLAGVKGTVLKLKAGGGGIFDSGPKIMQVGTTAPSTADGLIESPALPIKAVYVLELSADGFAPASTRWTHPS